MTKEMRPAHRTDILTDAFLYMGSKAAGRLCECYVYATYVLHVIPSDLQSMHVSC